MKISEVLTFSEPDKDGDVNCELSLENPRAGLILQIITDIFIEDARIIIQDEDCPECNESRLRIANDWKSVALIVDERLADLSLTKMEQHISVDIFLGFSQDVRKQVDILFNKAKEVPKDQRSKKQIAFIKFIKKFKKSQPNIGQMIALALGRLSNGPAFPETNTEE